MRHVRTSAAMLVAVVLMAACADAPTLPREAEAVRQGPSHDNQAPQGCVIDGYCVLPPISGGGCDPHLELDWSCDDGGGADCMTSQSAAGDSDYGLAGCPAPGTGPGPGAAPLPTPTEPPPSEPADTCNTGDPVVESDVIQTAFATIWAQSNYDPNAPHSQRREQGGWITSDGAGGLQFTPFPSSWARTPCQIAVPASITPPPNVVAWVHTHPYTNGDLLTECQQMTLPGGLQRPLTYRGDPSYADDVLTRTLRQSGYPNIRGYMIDADKITWYTGDDTPTTVGSYPRCGY